MSKLVTYGLLLGAAFFWGSGNVANKTVLESVGPLTAVGLRCLLAAAVLSPLLVFERRGWCSRVWFISALRVSALFAAALITQQYAFGSASVTNASFLINTSSVLTPIIAWLVLGERQRPCVACAAGLTLGGAWMMSGSGGHLISSSSGDIACLVSAVFYASWMVALGKHAIAHGQAFATTWLHCALTAVAVAPVAIGTEALTAAGVIDGLPDLIYLGVFSTAAAFGLTVIAQSRVSASVAAILVSAESIFGAAGGIWFLGERISALGVAGAALILFAIVIVATGSYSNSPEGARPRTPVPVFPSKTAERA